MGATLLRWPSAGSTSTCVLTIDPHPLLDAQAFITTWPRPLGEVPTAALTALMTLTAPEGLPAPDAAVRAAIRDLLRQAGYKPTGRGKPSSEYLIRAVTEGALGSINAAVDACNVASLHSGLPISVVALERATAPFRISVAAAGTKYVFNASGQSIDVGELICLFDAEGPCANAVKDAQRTKTSPGTTRTLSVLWGTNALPGRTAKTASWYRELVQSLGATTEALPA
jgi:DNA/RNA-binding domain of Phe-tRNA-synthetase-like protein